MKYSIIADVYEKIEATSKRLEMTNYLVELVRETPKSLIDKVVYLTQGKLYPNYKSIEIGMAEKMVIASIAKVSDVKKEKISRLWNEMGDLGSAAEKLLLEKTTMPSHLVSDTALTVREVYETLDEIAKTSGKGSVELKRNLLIKLITVSTPKEVKYLIRTVIGKLRLGVGDMTLLDALAIAYGGGKDARQVVEHAYNVSSDLGLVSNKLVRDGLEGIKAFSVTVGRPIRPMLCERLTNAEEILNKLGGKGAAEFKYDGLRIQAHISSKKIQLFSRRMETITHQFPDIVKALRNSIDVQSAIVEGECIAIDPNTGEFQPFQIITQRRGRKYHIEQKIVEIPVIYILFDALYVEGKALISQLYMSRRKILEKIVKETDTVYVSNYKIIDKPNALDHLMDQALEAGCEGLIIKSVSPDGVYQAGSRGFLWIKYKREYRSEMADTVDLVVVGAYAGRGRRAGTYGALLMAAYDDNSDSFKTVCKLGTGFDDETLAKLPTIFGKYKISHIHPRVDSKIEADYWFVPKKVLEVIGSELTISPSHTCGFGIIKKNSGLAIRFPRFSKKWREDKVPEDSTTVNEIMSMYLSQLKRMK